MHIEYLPMAYKIHTVSTVLTAALLLYLNFLGAVLKREFTYSRIFYFVCIYGSYSRAAVIKSAAVNTEDTVLVMFCHCPYNLDSFSNF